MNDSETKELFKTYRELIEKYLLDHIDKYCLGIDNYLFLLSNVLRSTLYFTRMYENLKASIDVVNEMTEEEREEEIEKTDCIVQFCNLLAEQISKKYHEFLNNDFSDYNDFCKEHCIRYKAGNCEVVKK